MQQSLKKCEKRTIKIIQNIYGLSAENCDVNNDRRFKQRRTAHALSNRDLNYIKGKGTHLTTQTPTETGSPACLANIYKPQ